ncbi:50S ribosomal protein L29 [Candidatus Woesearchaeota archaeon]|nr:50S ribosomal protein L29 [Candidatus Woesearchaeota archaeon]
MKIAKELQKISARDLAAKLPEARKELMKMRVQFATGASAPNPGKFKQTKKLIARIHTLLAQKGVQA